MVRSIGLMSQRDKKKITRAKKEVWELREFFLNISYFGRNLRYRICKCQMSFLSNLLNHHAASLSHGAEINVRAHSASVRDTIYPKSQNNELIIF